MVANGEGACGARPCSYTTLPCTDPSGAFLSNALRLWLHTRQGNGGNTPRYGEHYEVQKMAKSQTYDAATVLPMCRTALATLRETEQPGEGARLQKRGVLNALRPEITAMLRDGYTVCQIAAALAAAGDLRVRPKTITEVCGGPEQARSRVPRSRVRKRKPAQGRAADTETPAPTPRGGEPEAAATTPAATTPATGSGADRSTFAVKPDTDDL